MAFDQPSDAPLQMTDEAELVISNTMEGPSVVPKDSFDEEVAKQQAQILHDDIHGLGIEGSTIISVLCEHSNEQLQVIKEKYQQLYNKDLVDELKEDLLGGFEDLAMCRIQPSDEFGPNCLHDALYPPPWEGEMVSSEHRNEWLIEIICSKTKPQIEELEKRYQELYRFPLTDDLSANVKKDGLKKLLLGLLQKERSQETEVIDDEVQQDAEVLSNAEMLNDDMLDIFLTRHWPHLRAVFDAYKEKTGKEIEEFCDSVTGGDLETAIKSLIQFARKPSGYFAARLKSALDGEIDDDQFVYRVIVANAEKNLNNIRAEFSEMFGEPVEQVIDREFSGDVRNFLLKLLNPAMPL